MALALILPLAACAGAPGKRANEDTGPVSAHARNALATSNPAGLVAVGEGFERSGDLTAALKLYLQAQAAAPELLVAQVAVARVYVKLGRTDEGLAQLRRLYTAHPDDGGVRRAFVEALVLSGNYAEAADALAPIVAAPDANTEYLDLAGRLAEVNGDAEGARTYFDRALRIAPGAPAVVRHLALSFALAGNFETAVALLQPGMDRADTLSDTQESLALVYALSGQYEAAMHIARAVLPPTEIPSLRIFYGILPKLEHSEQAQALMFDRIPTDIVKRMAPDASK